MTTPANQLLEKATAIATLFTTGLALSDVPLVLGEVIETAEAFSDLTGKGKREVAIALFSEVIRQTDGPGPDLFIDPILNAIVPPFIDLIVAASKGDLAINDTAPKT